MSVISLAGLVLNVVRLLPAIYQTKCALTSPLIPGDVVRHITEPISFQAAISATGAAAGALFYYFRSYIAVLVIAGLTLIAEELFVRVWWP